MINTTAENTRYPSTPTTNTSSMIITTASNNNNSESNTTISSTSNVSTSRRTVEHSQMMSISEINNSAINNNTTVVINSSGNIDSTTFYSLTRPNDTNYNNRRTNLKKKINNWFNQNDLVEEIETSPYTSSENYQYGDKKYSSDSSIFSSSDISAGPTFLYNSKRTICEYAKNSKTIFGEMSISEDLVSSLFLESRDNDGIENDGFYISCYDVGHNNNDCFSEATSSNDLDSIIFRPLEKLPTLE